MTRTKARTRQDKKQDIIMTKGEDNNGGGRTRTKQDKRQNKDIIIIIIRAKTRQETGH